MMNAVKITSQVLNDYIYIRNAFDKMNENCEQNIIP